MSIPDENKIKYGRISKKFLPTLDDIGWFNYEWKCQGCSSLFDNVIDLERHCLKCVRKRCHNSCADCDKVRI